MLMLNNKIDNAWRCQCRTRDRFQPISVDLLCSGAFFLVKACGNILFHLFILIMTYECSKTVHWTFQCFICSNSIHWAWWHFLWTRCVNQMFKWLTEEKKTWRQEHDPKNWLCVHCFSWDCVEFYCAMIYDI